MDDLLTIAFTIIGKLDRENIEIGYTKMNQQLYDEIPKFVKILKQYSNNPEYFLKLLGDIYSHWGQYLSKSVSNDMQNYSILFNNLKLIELERQKALMEISMMHPDNIRARDEEMNSLTGDIENMFSSTSELADILGKTSIGQKQNKGISKHKYPKRYKQTVKQTNKR